LIYRAEFHFTIAKFSRLPSRRGPTATPTLICCETM
jgi:hypothetical protein